MSVSVYDSRVRNLKPDEDVLPHLIFMGNYGEVICFLRRNYPSREQRHNVVVKMYQPPFHDGFPVEASSWIDQSCSWIPGTMLPAVP